MSKFREMDIARETLRETASMTNADVISRSKAPRPLASWFSYTTLAIGTFVFVWLLCTAFAFTPAQAQVTSAATHPTTPSLPAAWSGWSQVPGNGATLAGPGATVFQGKLYLFVEGTDKKIYQNGLTGSSWSGWSEVPGNGLTPSGPAATVYQGALYVFVQGTDQKIYLNKLT